MARTKDSWKKLGMDLAAQMTDIDTMYRLCKVRDQWAVRELIKRAKALRRAERKPKEAK